MRLYQCRAEMKAHTSRSSDVSKELPVLCAAPEKEVTKRKNTIKNGGWGCKQDANMIGVVAQLRSLPAQM